jgi:antitoxin component YwqK of YwqJK toxin-antitoxin module
MGRYIYTLGISVVLLFSKMAAQGQNVPKPLQSAFLIAEGIMFHDKQIYDSARTCFEQITRNDSLYGTACYEIALGYYSEKEYDSALFYIQKAVNSGEIGITEQARVLMGSIFDDAGMPDSALACYQIALKTAPYNSKLLYDFGCTYFRMDSLDLAEQYLIQAIKINPTYYRATFMLGKLNEKMNRRIEAMLCYYMANLINPSAELTRGVELYLAGESDIDPLRKEYIPTSPSFEKIEEYINSKIAMTAKYKPVFKSQSAFVRQGDLLFKYLEYDPKADNFYMNYYVPLFIYIRDKKFMETAMYVYFSGFNIENVQKWIKSNSPKIQKYYGAVKEEINRLSARGFVHATRYDGMNYVYSDGILSAFGKYSDEKNKVREGLWHFLGNGGFIASTENYKNGKLNGEDKDFNLQGQLTGSFHYVNGMMSGVGRLYHDNGQLQAEGSFENDKLNGKLTYYFPTGQRRSEENYKTGMLNGVLSNYYKNGNIADSVSWTNGKQNGIYCAMYPNGQISAQGRLVNDLVEGELVYYYPDGQISAQGNMIKNNYAGKWVTYHPNGAISAVSFYNDKGNLSDTAKYFDANGILTSMLVYSNNGKNIQEFYCRPDGSIYQKQEIKNEIPTKLEVFDKDGKVLETINISGNAETFVKHYNEFGKVSAEGIRKNGKQEGRWVYYGIFGNIERISYFKKGDRNGADTLFFSNGKIKTISNYKDDKADGYGLSYNLAGKITVEGYCVNDNPEGYWLYYDNFGNITQKAYLTNGEPDQWQQYYYTNGNLSSEIYYNNVLFREIINYDTT